jgi:enoyl-CoA hydratase
MYDHYKALKIEKRGAILVVMLDNPPTNASYPGMHTELAEVFQVVNRDDATKVVLLTGAGEKAFSAGGDIKRMLERIETRDHASLLASLREGKEIIYSMLRLEKPLIARINGHAIGLGASLAVMSDFSYMIESANIGDTHVKVGLTAGDGGAFMWPMLIGFSKAKRYLMTGDLMTGKEAAEIGLITGTAATHAELDELCYGMADRLAKGATLAINSTKMAINLLLRRSLEGVMEAHLGAETATFLSKDHHAAAKAFANKEQPVFTGE